MKQPAQAPDWASVFVTVTVTAPTAWAGVVAVIEVAFTTTTLVAALPPIVAVAPVAKPVPVIVTAVPPAIGPVVGAMLLPRGRQLLSIDRLVLTASALFAAVLLALAAVTAFAAACGLLVVGGAAWITVMANLNLAAQTAVPAWVRSRGLSVYLLVSQGGMAAGGAAWGALAAWAGTPAALAASAAGLLLGLAVARWQRLPACQVA